MKRDWDLIRQVLLEVEELDTHTRDKKVYEVNRGSPNENDAKAEHALLLFEAGYIDGIDSTTFDGPSIIAPRLTWDGHELLATMRSAPVWKRIKDISTEKGVELTFDGVKALAISGCRSMYLRSIGQPWRAAKRHRWSSYRRSIRSRSSQSSNHPSRRDHAVSRSNAGPRRGRSGELRA